MGAVFQRKKVGLLRMIEPFFFFSVTYKSSGMHSFNNVLPLGLE